MNKVFFLLFLLVFQAGGLSANEIDNLKTVDEVNKFLRRTVIAPESLAYLHQKKSDNARFGKNKFHKIDLDQNGLTDLIIDGVYCFAVVDKGAGKYGFHPIDRGIVQQSRYVLVNIIEGNERPKLVVRRYDLKSGFTAGVETQKILVYKFDEFIEFNPNPDDLKIEEIKFSALGCLGNCPVYDMTISPDKTTVFNALRYVKKKGLFKSTLSTDYYDQIVQTINYIGIENMADSYTPRKMDLAVLNIEIKFDQGKVKKITSFGMDENFGLNNLFTRLYALPDLQQWTK